MVEAAGDAGDGGTHEQRPAMRRRIDAAGQARDHHQAEIAQFGGERLGDTHAVARRVARADDGDQAAMQHADIAEHGDRRRRIRQLRQQRRIGRIAQDQQARPDALDRADLVGDRL